MFFRFLIFSLLFYMGYRFFRNVFRGLTGGRDTRDRDIGTSQHPPPRRKNSVDNADIEDASFEEIDDDPRA